MLDEKAARTLLESAVADVNTPSPSIDALLARGRSSRNRRRTLTAAGAFVIALLLVGLGTTTTALLTDRSPVSTQPLGADATPEQVVRAFVSAKNARDKNTALSLATPHHADSLRRSVGGLFNDKWWSRAKPITDLHLVDPHQLSASERENSAAQGWQHAISLRATYQRDGETEYWGYVLVRNTTTERWSIADEGQG